MTKSSLLCLVMFWFVRSMLWRDRHVAGWSLCMQEQTPMACYFSFLFSDILIVLHTGMNACKLTHQRLDATIFVFRYILLTQRRMYLKTRYRCVMPLRAYTQPPNKRRLSVCWQAHNISMTPNFQSDAAKPINKSIYDAGWSVCSQAQIPTAGAR